MRSPWLFRINAGSCNGCDVESRHHRLHSALRRGTSGLPLLWQPRHADIVLVTGPLTTRVRDRAQGVGMKFPEPKVTVAVGICPISGGVFREGYSIEGPSTAISP